MWRLPPPATRIRPRSGPFGSHRLAMQPPPPAGCARPTRVLPGSYRLAMRRPVGLPAEVRVDSQARNAAGLGAAVGSADSGSSLNGESARRRRDTIECWMLFHPFLGLQFHSARHTEFLTVSLDRRFGLPAMFPGLARAVPGTSPTPYRLLDIAGNHGQANWTILDADPGDPLFAVEKIARRMWAAPPSSRIRCIRMTILLRGSASFRRYRLLHTGSGHSRA